MKVSPYIFFDGRCEEAIDFYKAALGAEVEMVMRFSDAPDCEPSNISPEMKTKIMHAALRIDDATIMASDGMCQGNGKPKFEGISLSLTVRDIAAAEKTFGVLAEGGEIRQQLIETFFAPRFGVVADKFGVSWMIVVGS